MKKRAWLLSSVCLVFLCAIVLVACAGNSSTSQDDSVTLVTPGKLTVASDLGSPPFSYIEEGTTNAQGYEVEMMDIVAQRMGLELEYLPAQKFDSIIPMLKQGGKADVGCANFTITDARKEEIDFTIPYLDSNQGLVTLIGSELTTENDLNQEGIKVAVQSGTTGSDWVQENLTQAECVILDDPIQMFAGVQTGLYDACVGDLPIMSYLCKESFNDCQVTISIPTGEQYGICVSKDNPALTAELDRVLAEMEEDGTTDELQTKWFGAPL